MSDIALRAPLPADISRKPAERERISLRIKRAVNALVSGECKTQKDAAALAGITPEHLCTELKKPKVVAFYERRTREIIRGAQMRAVSRVVQLLDGESEHVALDASKHVLAINGIKPADSSQVSVNVAISPGYVIDLQQDPRDITPLRSDTQSGDKRG